jgi:repressor LexA
MATFGERFRELRKAMGLKQKELATKLSMAESTISMYEMEKREPDYETLEMIADFFNVDINYLIGRTDKTTYIPSIQSRFIVRKVPVFGRIPAGTPFEAIEDICGEVEVPTKYVNTEDLFGLLVVGDSMNRVIPDGYIALLQKTDTLENGEIGALLINEQDATLKKFFKLTDYVVLEPLSYNLEHKPTMIGSDGPEISVIGKLLWACSAKEL